MPATNSPPTLARCVAAIRAADEAPDDVVVVDSPPYSSPAAARNLGVSRTNAEVVVFVDSDVIVAPDAFVRIRSHYARDHELTAVFGAYDDIVATTRRAAAFKNLQHHHVHTRSRGSATTFWAGLGAVRREAFERVGGFDETRYRRPSIEDVELGLRLTDAGGRIVLDPAIRGTHLKDWTTGQMLRTDFYDRGLPWMQLLLERREVPTTLNLGWRDRAGALAAVASAIFAVRGRPLPAVAGAAPWSP